VQQIDRRLDRDLETLAASKTAWARLTLERKLAMLQTLRRNVYRLAPEWVAASARAKGLLPESPLAGEEWISGPWAVLYALTRYIRTLTDISRRGSPLLPRMHAREDGRTVLDVFPRSLYDRVLMNGVRASVWMQPGVTPGQVRAQAASFYQRTQPEGSVALVLGAGNISSIAPLDVLYKLLANGAVCMLKMNPVNDYLGPIFEQAFEPFCDAGYLRFAYGGADVGAYLCAHEAVQEIHITGSERTHHAIVREAGAGKLITSELGNVSPTIVVPGPWTADDLAFQAEHIATQKAHNAGFNCIAAQVLILPQAWEHSASLADSIISVFGRMEQRPEYYPGASGRRSALAGVQTPLRTIVHLDAANAGHPALETEAFCGVLACVQLAGTVEEYVRAAVAFANERLHGTLGVNLIVHPATMRARKALIDEAIAELRYGCVGVNAWTGAGYFITETPWGAYPGHTRENAGSGIGVVHNSFLLEGTEKSVVSAPFAPFPRSMQNGEYTLLPKPPWFVTNPMEAEIGRALCDFEIAPAPSKAARVAALAMRA
jgi:aldehyde dehydrogenase (NAD(P)+)